LTDYAILFEYSPVGDYSRRNGDYTMQSIQLSPISATIVNGLEPV